MKKKFSIVFIAIMLIMSFTSCSNSKDSISSNDTSKVLATVDNIKITQQQVDARKKDSEFSQQEKVSSDKEVLDKIIEEQLILIKAKELNITMSDNEVKENYKGMLQQMSFKKYVEGDENKIDKNTFEALHNTFVIQKTKDKLGFDIDQALKQLKEKVKIKYYN
jgi:hypothetical protein